MSDNMTRDDIRKLADRLGHPSVTDRFIERVEDQLNCHYTANDPMAAFTIQTAFIEDELKALRGDVRREAEEAAKTGATDGARIGATEGINAGTASLTSSVLLLSSRLQDWLDKGYVAVTANNTLLRGIQDQMAKGKGVTLKVDQVTLSPQTRRELLAAIPEVTARAIIAEHKRPLRRANTAIFGLVLVLICLLTIMVHQQTSRPTEQTVHWAADDVSAKGDQVFAELLADHKLNPSANNIPRDIALTGARLMSDRVAELTLGRENRSSFALLSNQLSWEQNLWKWAETHQAGSIALGAMAMIIGFLGGKGWR